MKLNPLNGEILRLALPSIFANLTIPLVGMVDVAVAGHLGSSAGVGAAVCIGAVAVGSMLFDLLYWNFAFLRVGTGGLVAQALGRRDFDECGAVFLRGVVLALLSSAVILLLQWPFQKLCFLAIKTTPAVMDLAMDYFLVRVWAAPATLTLMVMKGWFVGMQDSFSSMITDLVINAMNVVASIVLAMGIGGWKGLGFDGIALGTVVAQYSGLLLTVFILAFKYRKVRIFPYHRPRGKLSAYLEMNNNYFIRSVCFIAIYVGFTAIAARYGETFLSVSSILMKLLMIFSYFIDGFAYSAEALVGRFVGERNRKELVHTVRNVFIWSMGVALFFIFLYGFGGNALTGILTSDKSVTEACGKFMWWLLLMPPLGCAAFIWDGVYQGATASVPVRNAMLLATAAFFAVYFIGVLSGLIPSESEGPGLETSAMNLLLGAYFAHLAARTAYLSFSYRHCSRQFWN